jgi:hypothetical protein
VDLSLYSSGPRGCSWQTVWDCEGTTGGDKHSGWSEGEDTSNVVRLPRDWLGPRSELVPFGPSADAARPTGDYLTQDDFWGGELDSIPRPVVAPTVPTQPPVERAAATTEALAEAPAQTVAVPGEDLVPPSPHDTRKRTAGVLATGLTVAACIAVVAGSLPDGQRHVERRATTRSYPTTLSAVPSAVILPRRRPALRHATTKAPSRSASRTQAHAKATTAAASHVANSAGSNSVTPASYHTVAPASHQSSAAVQRALAPPAPDQTVSAAPAPSAAGPASP